MARGITDIREYRAKQRRAGSIRWVLILVFLIVCLFAGYFFARSDFFTIRNFVVEGNTQLTDERLIEVSGMHIGDNIFSYTLNDVEKWLQVEPYVKDARLQRRLPGVVLISITERQAVAIVQSGSAFVEIDDTGRVLTRYRLVSGMKLPLISGVETEGALPGFTLRGEGMAEALAILRALPADAEDIGEINVANPQYIRLYTISGTEIRLGDSSGFADKYLVYSNILRDNKEKGGTVLEYIDVSTRVPAISTQN